MFDLTAHLTPDLAWRKAGGAGGVTPAFQADFTGLTSLPSWMSFNRATTGTYFDASGVLQTAAIDAPRFDHAWNGSAWVATGFLVEPEQRTNVFLQSGSPANQTISVANGTAYTVSFYGTGTLTLSGAAAQTATGSGANVRTSYTFTAATTSLTIAVSGTVTYPQVEAGSFATSYIPTTTAAVTRSADIVQLAGAADVLLQAAAASMVLETNLEGVSNSSRLLGQNDGNGFTPLYVQDATTVGSYDGNAITTPIGDGVSWAGNIVRSGSAWDGSNTAIVADGGTVATMAHGFSLPAGTYLFSNRAANSFTSGWLRKIDIYSSKISSSDLQTATQINNSNIAAWGDSLTSGQGASSPSTTSYPSALATSMGRLVLNGGNGGDTSTQVNTRMLADTVDANRIVVIWAGRNDVDGNPANTATIQSTILSNIASMVGHINSPSKRFVVMSILNQATEFPGAAAPGDAIYTQIQTINAAIASAYSSNYLDIRSLLITASGGTNFVDISYRSDGLHLNDTGYAYVASQVKTFINSKGW